VPEAPRLSIRSSVSQRASLGALGAPSDAAAKDDRPTPSGIDADRRWFDFTRDIIALGVEVVRNQRTVDAWRSQSGTQRWQRAGKYARMRGLKG
jgi:hypothetical protein